MAGMQSSPSVPGGSDERLLNRFFSGSAVAIWDRNRPLVDRITMEFKSRAGSWLSAPTQEIIETSKKCGTSPRQA